MQTLLISLRKMKRLKGQIRSPHVFSVIFSCILFRSVIWATSENRILLWLQAEDKPYKGIDANISKDALDRRRLSWLEYSD